MVSSIICCVCGSCLGLCPRLPTMCSMRCGRKDKTQSLTYAFVVCAYLILHSCIQYIVTYTLCKVNCCVPSCAQRAGAAARESLGRDRPGGLAFHACGSASPFRTCCCHSSQKQVVSAPLTPCAHSVAANTRGADDHAFTGGA